MKKRKEMQGYISQYMHDREAFKENEKKKMEQEVSLHHRILSMILLCLFLFNLSIYIIGCKNT